MSDEPDEGEEPADPRLKVLRWVGLGVTAPIVVVFVMIMLFVAETELSHDEADCPFVRVETRELEDGSVIHDEMRRCQDEIEEHRFRLLRDGQEAELGRRRLPRHRYAEGQWHWTAALGERGAHIHVENRGLEDADFHERPGEREQR